MPVLNVGTKENPSYLPAQVCVVLPGQPAKNHLSPSQTQRMIQFAVRGPADNANSIVSKGLITAGVSTGTSTQLVSKPLDTVVMPTSSEVTNMAF